jgi:hypothetical protein
MDKATQKLMYAISCKYNMQGYNNTCLFRNYDGSCPICNYKWVFDVDIHILDWYRGKPCSHCGWGEVLQKPRVSIWFIYRFRRLYRTIKWWFKIRIRNIYRIISI